MAWLDIGKARRWRKMQEHIKKTGSVLIGLTGSTHLRLTQEAISLVLQEPHQTVFSPQQIIERRTAALQLEPLLRENPQAVILPVGVQHPGDIDWISAQLPFQIAVVTQISSKNLQEFGSKNMVAHEHTSLVSALPAGGHAVLNADDELVANMAYHTSAQTTLYGTSSTAHVRAIRSVNLPAGGFAVEVAIAGRHHQLSLPHVVAFPQIYAALAALSVAHILEKDVAAVIPNLSELHPPAGELALISGPRGSKILDASADATPETILAALHALRTQAARRRIAILGDLNDQAGETVGAHKRAGRAAAESVHIFVAVGEHMRYAAGEVLLRRPGPDVHHFLTAEEVGEWLAPYISEGDAILVMGGRDMRMKKIIADLANGL